MKFPLLVGHQRVSPPDGKGVCPVCLVRQVSVDVEHAVIRGGALSVGEDGSVDSERQNEAFLFFDWESGIRMEEGREVETPHAEFEIARDVAGGQFTVMFCSTACLRSFLNECVDRLEQQVEKLNVLPSKKQ